MKLDGCRKFLGVFALGSLFSIQTAFAYFTVPVVTTGLAPIISGIGPYSVTISGNVVDWGGAIVTPGFNVSGGTLSGLAPTAIGSAGGTFTATLSGLTCGNTYDFAATATNIAGTTTGALAAIVTPACPPAQLYFPTSGITADTYSITSGAISTSITVEDDSSTPVTTLFPISWGFQAYGTTNPGSCSWVNLSTYYVESIYSTYGYGYGYANEYAGYSSFTQEVPSLSSFTAQNYTLTNVPLSDILPSGTPKWYCLFVVADPFNSLGAPTVPSYIYPTPFLYPAVAPVVSPVVVTGTAPTVSGPGPYGVTISGSVSNWGGSTVTPGFNVTGGTVSGLAPVTMGSAGGLFSAILSNLTCGNTYTFTATGTNSAGIGTGASSTIVTPACLPSQLYFPTSGATDDSYAITSGSITTSVTIENNSSTPVSTLFPLSWEFLAMGNTEPASCGLVTPTSSDTIYGYTHTNGTGGYSFFTQEVTSLPSSTPQNYGLNSVPLSNILPTASPTWYCMYVVADPSNTLGEASPPTYMYSAPFMFPDSSSEAVPNLTKESETFDTFPNPASNTIHFKLSSDFSENLKFLEIRNAAGMMVMKSQTASPVDVRALVPGSYFVRAINQKGKIMTSKFQKVSE